MKIQLQECFKPILENKHTYLVYYGGRGGGKSESIAQTLVLRASQEKLRILCMRETQNTIADSVKSLLEKWIYSLDLGEYFTIKSDRIEVYNGGEFLFKGMQQYNAGNIKSIADINITWIEEAQYFSKKSWDLLVPSVIRTKNPKIILTFNPNTSDDIVYRTFISSTPPPKSYVKLLNYFDNPYFKGSALDEKRKHDERTMNPSEYQHVWLGALQSKSEASIFKGCNFETTEEYNRNNYIQLVIACDPATTNKDYSNEYGVVVLGLTHSGVIHLIEDASESYTPSQFSIIVSELYTLYKADMVVIEVNNGGDFLKTTLLLHDPLLNIFEVRASTDKIRRALPIANLAYLNKLKHIKSPRSDDGKILRQMDLLSLNGYNGLRGESPDRLDAYVWGCYVLANLNYKDTESSFFHQVRTIKQDEKIFIIRDDIYFISYLKDCLGVIKCRVGKNNKLKKALYIYDAYIVNSQFDVLDFMKAKEIFIRDIPLNYNLIDSFVDISHNSQVELHIYKDKIKDNKIFISNHNTNNANNDDNMVRLNEYIKKNDIFIHSNKLTQSSYNGDFGNLLETSLTKYYPTTKAYYPLLDLLSDTAKLLL